MKEYSISDFKAHAIGILNGLAKSGESVLVTKRGKPLAQISPYRPPENKPRPGKLAGTLSFEKDLISPLGEELWEAARADGSDSD
jgi:prevent-host-death family protein